MSQGGQFSMSLDTLRAMGTCFHQLKFARERCVRWAHVPTS